MQILCCACLLAIDAGDSLLLDAINPEALEQNLGYRLHVIKKIECADAEPLLGATLKLIVHSKRAAYLAQ